MLIDVCSVADLMLPQSCRVAMESLCGSLQKVLEDPCSSAVVFRLLCLRKHLEGPLDQTISLSSAAASAGVKKPLEFAFLRNSLGMLMGPARVPTKRTRVQEKQG